MRNRDHFVKIHYEWLQVMEEPIALSKSKKVEELIPSKLKVGYRKEDLYEDGYRDDKIRDVGQCIEDAFAQFDRFGNDERFVEKEKRRPIG